MKTGGWKQPNGEMNVEANRMDLEPNRQKSKSGRSEPKTVEMQLNIQAG